MKHPVYLLQLLVLWTFTATSWQVCTCTLSFRWFRGVWTLCSKTSAHKIQMLGNHPKERINIQNMAKDWHQEQVRTCQLFSLHHRKTLLSQLSQAQSWIFLQRTHRCKSLSAASCPTDLISGLSMSVTSEDPSHFHLMPQNKWNWSFRFFISQIVADLLLC